MSSDDLVLECGDLDLKECALSPWTWCHELCSFRVLFPLHVIRGWGLLKLHLWISPLWLFKILQNWMLDYLNHVHIWQLSPQLSCSDTCQIWMWYVIVIPCFDKTKKNGRNNKNEGKWFCNPHIDLPKDTISIYLAERNYCCWITTKRH